MDWLTIITFCIASLGLGVGIWSIIDTRKRDKPIYPSSWTFEPADKGYKNPYERN